MNKVKDSPLFRANLLVLNVLGHMIHENVSPEAWYSSILDGLWRYGGTSEKKWLSENFGIPVNNFVHVKWICGGQSETTRNSVVDF